MVPPAACNSVFGDGNTHIAAVLGAADGGCDLHAVRGGDRLSEVELADPETSVFRVCFLIQGEAERGSSRGKHRGQAEKYVPDIQRHFDTQEEKPEFADLIFMSTIYHTDPLFIWAWYDKYFLIYNRFFVFLHFLISPHFLQIPLPLYLLLVPWYIIYEEKNPKKKKSLTLVIYLQKWSDPDILLMVQLTADSLSPRLTILSSKTKSWW